jgi:glycerophosphoryl diester phosphodiesterase
VSPYYKLVTKEQVDAAHKAGLQVVPWTANKPEEWQHLIACGVDAIISDDPAELISFLKKQPPPSR